MVTGSRTAERSKEKENARVGVIADRSTGIGFKLAGVHSVKELNVKPTVDEFDTAFKELTGDSTIKFIITTETMVESYGIERFEKLRRTLTQDIMITVIPDRAGTRSKIGEEHLRVLIRRAIGRKRND